MNTVIPSEVEEPRCDSLKIISRDPSTPKHSGLGMTINMSLEKVIEALLFSAQKPLSIHEITAAIKGAEERSGERDA